MQSSTHLVGARDDARELVRLALPLYHCLDNTGMVRSQVDEAMGDAGLPDSLEEGERRGIHLGGVRRQSPNRCRRMLSRLDKNQISLSVA